MTKLIKHIRTGAEYKVVKEMPKTVTIECTKVGHIQQPYIKVGSVSKTSPAYMAVAYIVIS